MASRTAADANASSLDTPITIKVVYEGSNRKFKLPLQDLSPSAFAEKIRAVLQIPAGQVLVLERFSDSGNAYITLDQSNASTYKQLYRAAKAKLKLRIRATLPTNIVSSVTQEPYRHERPAQASASHSLATKLPCPSIIGAIGHSMMPKGLAGARDFSCVQARDQFFEQLTNISKEREMRQPTLETPSQHPSSFWQIFCNNCDKPMSDAHFHCSICDSGDYDLCEACVEMGQICPGEGHWLIKRFIKGGKVVTGATEVVLPKAREVVESIRELPVPCKPEVRVQASVEPSRTCNSCVKVLPESVLVTCSDCPDYDLCLLCFKVERGHHPAHSFVAADKATTLAKDVAQICVPEYKTRHHALCDGCDEPIFGVRHKCMTCPDWDFCEKCFKNNRTSHPGHRFVPVYENLEAASISRSIHFGILCDGPLCNDKPGKAYIKGVRYKCAVCHDTDFCANCEAHPNNKHNETHPMIKFKTPVRGAHITTVDESPGRPRQVAGDATRPAHRMSPSLRSVATLPPYTLPMGPKLANTLHTATSQTTIKETLISSEREKLTVDLDAHFVKDTISDGACVEANETFVQTWIMANPGPKPWPVGSVVEFVGGDKMSRNVASMPAGSTSNATHKAVYPGEHYSFVVLMQAPARIGKHISYWRLKAPSGAAFGHKLWCDINVKTSTRKTALEDYQTQLMLLEQQNERRLKNSPALASSINSMSSSAAIPSSAAVSALGEVETEVSMASSTMVFPILEKESPSSSTLREPTTEVLIPVVFDIEGTLSNATVAGAETISTTTSNRDVEECFENLESVEYQDSDDDGFLTDEEYDILDASDEEAPRRSS